MLNAIKGFGMQSLQMTVAKYINWSGIHMIQKLTTIITMVNVARTSFDILFCSRVFKIDPKFLNFDVLCDCELKATQLIMKYVGTGWMSHLHGYDSINFIVHIAQYAWRNKYSKYKAEDDKILVYNIMYNTCIIMFVIPN